MFKISNSKKENEISFSEFEITDKEEVLCKKKGKVYYN